MHSIGGTHSREATSGMGKSNCVQKHTEAQGGKLHCKWKEKVMNE